MFACFNHIDGVSYLCMIPRGTKPGAQCKVKLNLDNPRADWIKVTLHLTEEELTKLQTGGIPFPVTFENIMYDIPVPLDVKPGDWFGWPLDLKCRSKLRINVTVPPQITLEQIQNGCPLNSDVGGIVYRVVVPLKCQPGETFELIVDPKCPQPSWRPCTIPPNLSQEEIDATKTLECLMPGDDPNVFVKWSMFRDVGTEPVPGLNFFFAVNENFEVLSVAV